MIIGGLDRMGKMYGVKEIKALLCIRFPERITQTGRDV